MRSDWNIREDVMSELAWEPDLKESQVGVQVVGGVVVLGGIVATPAIAAAARVAAHRAPGVKDVISQLRVETGEAGMPDDLTIARALRHALDATPAVEGDLVRTTVSDGIVTLSGMVHADRARRSAGEAAGKIAGVKVVHNELAVDPRAAFIVVEDAVRRVVDRHAAQSRDRLSVSIDGGRVHVSGPVGSGEDRRAIIAALRALPGVDSIDEQLVVAGP